VLARVADTGNRGKRPFPGLIIAQLVAHIFRRLRLDLGEGGGTEPGPQSVLLDIDIIEGARGQGRLFTQQVANLAQTLRQLSMRVDIPDHGKQGVLGRGGGIHVRQNPDLILLSARVIAPFG
jgi:hypothetical protein